MMDVLAEASWMGVIQLRSLDAKDEMFGTYLGIQRQRQG